MLTGQTAAQPAPHKLDRRVQRTQQLLGDAFVALILEKGYEAVTIKEITERANVAYVTFFRHYRDKDQLLLQRLETGLDRLHGQIQAAAQEAGQGSVWRTADAEGGRLIFEDVAQHSALYRILLASQGATQIRQRVRDRIAAIFLADCVPLQSVTPALPVEVVAHHIATALLGLIEWWLNHGMPYPPARMAEIYTRLLIAPALAALVDEAGPLTHAPTAAQETLEGTV